MSQSYFLMFISSLVLANVLLGRTCMGLILPIVKCDLLLTKEATCVLSAIVFAGIIVSSHLWGFLADTKVLDVILSPDDIRENGKSKEHDITLSFPEALALTKFGKFNYFLMFISGLVLANVLLETTGIGFILPIAQCDLLLTNQDKGILSAIGFAGIIVSSHLWGFLADTKGRRKVMRPTLLAGFVMTFFSSFSHKFWLMVVLRFLNGFFVSGGSATIYAYIGEFHSDKTRSRVMMGSSFIFGLGAMIVPIIAFTVINRDWILPMGFIDFKPWRLFMIVCGIPGLVCGISMYILPESPKFLLSIGKEGEAIEVLRKMLRWNCSNDKLQVSHIITKGDDINTNILSSQQNNNSNFAVIFMRTMWNQTVPLFNRKYLRVTLIVCTVQFWLHVVQSGLYMWFPHIINSMAEFMKDHPGENKQVCQIVHDKHEALYNNNGTMQCITKLENSTYMYSLILEILFASTFAVIGLIINYVGKIKILFSIMVLCSGCGFATVLLPDPQVSSYLYVMLFIMGTAINVLGATTVELYPTNLRAMAICISLMMGRLGGVVGSNIVGILLEDNCELTFYISCAAVVACAFLALFIPRKSIEQEAEEKNLN